MSERWRHLIFETSPLPSYGPLQLQRMLRLLSSRLARGAAAQHAIVSARCRGHAVRAHGRAACSAACKSQTGLPASSSADSGRCMSPRCARSRIGRSRRRCYCSATAPRPRRAYTSSVRRGCPGWMVCGCEPPDGSRSRWSVYGSCLHAATVQAPSSAKAQLRLGTWCYREGVAVLQGAGGGGGGGGGAGGGGGGGATGAVASTSSGSGGGVVLKLAERAQLRHLIDSAFPGECAAHVCAHCGAPREPRAIGLRRQRRTRNGCHRGRCSGAPSMALRGDVWDDGCAPLTRERILPM